LLSVLVPVSQYCSSPVDLQIFRLGRDVRLFLLYLPVCRACNSCVYLTVKKKGPQNVSPSVPKVVRNLSSQLLRRQRRMG